MLITSTEMIVIWADTGPRLYRGSTGLEGGVSSKEFFSVTITPGTLSTDFKAAYQQRWAPGSSLQEWDRGEGKGRTVTMHLAEAGSTTVKRVGFGVCGCGFKF